MLRFGKVWLISSPDRRFYCAPPLLRRCWSSSTRADIAEQQSAAESAKFCRSSAPTFMLPLPPEPVGFGNIKKYCCLLHRPSLGSELCRFMAIQRRLRIMLDELSRGDGGEGRGVRARGGRGRRKEEACQPHIDKEGGGNAAPAERGRGRHCPAFFFVFPTH